MGYGDVLSYGFIVQSATTESISSMSERTVRPVTVHLPGRLGL